MRPSSSENKTHATTSEEDRRIFSLLLMHIQHVTEGEIGWRKGGEKKLNYDPIIGYPRMV